MAVADSTHPGVHDAKTGTIASLTKYIPFENVTHAGGQYVLRHYQALSESYDITSFAPDTPLNRDALRRGGTPSASLMRGMSPGASGGWKTLFDIESVWAGSAIGLPIRRLFRSDRAPWTELAQADIIEFQWSEMMALGPLVRRRLPHVPMVGIAHDVITQRWRRAATTHKSRVVRSAYAEAARRSAAQEARSFSQMDRVIVFSEKDRELIIELAPTATPEVVHPGLGPLVQLQRAEERDEPIVLFTGALNRLDNSAAVEWFLQRMWPAVLSAVPSARFVVAGANPPERLARIVSQTERVELTGFVDSLDPYYARASVFVAPLRNGAGVKFKTLDAMLRGVPVVATSVGAEGIDAPHLFAGIHDDPELFARAVVAELQTPDRARSLAAQAWADGVYGAVAFRNRLTKLYSEILSK